MQGKEPWECNPPKSCFTCPFSDCRRPSQIPTKGESEWMKQTGIAARAYSQHAKGILSFKVKADIRNQRKREKRRNMKKQNMCQRCFDRPVVEGHTMCADCLAGMRARKDTRDRFREEHHICRACGHPIDGASKILCNKCLEKQRERNKRYRAKSRAKREAERLKNDS